MKETVTANIGTEAFTLDEDAYNKLRSYLGDIRSRLPEDDTETLDDIELRIAEIFREQVTTHMRVVTLAMVDNTMRRMGSPADFGQRHTHAPYDKTFTTEAPRKLYRSRQHRSLGGVCGGLADYLNTDATLIRVIMGFGIFFGGVSFWIYLLLWLIIPEEPAQDFTLNN